MASEPGKGSAFTVFLPQVDVEATEKAEEEETLPTGTEHILAVDDEETIIRLLRMNLESLGYRVSATGSSEAALEMVENDPDRFDLVITDMTMPRMTGDVLAREIMAIRSNLPVILCTGYSNKINREKAMGMGIRGFLEKPILRGDLARAVRRLLDGGL